ncbi:Structural constituent of ribosome [Desmophyllum pertusum]|uniref:Small ribosomal subunit protein mS23 n=1 Tax=Desmophyllum pertusum TaxID=174260 RepID=A0A9W9ZSV9_9CNID|nr:Structural constituent of ribosome [Desmophyllum pertusum]
MVGSRHLRGTVLSRVRNLLRSGAITKQPVWFPVVDAFPPLTETKLNRKGDEELMHKIMYPEDEFRKQFYQRFQTVQPLYLWGDDSSHCDKFVDSCMKLVEQGMDKEEAIENTVSTLYTSKGTTLPDDSEDIKDSYSFIFDSKGRMQDFSTDDGKHNR